MSVKSTIDVRIVGIVGHVYPVVKNTEKHNFRQGLAGCWCEPEVYLIDVDRLGFAIKTAVHAGVTPDTARALLERA